MSKRKKSPQPENTAIDSQPYQPLGAAEDLFYCHEREVLLAGPAGTGKTRAALEKMFLCMQKYSSMRCLLARKTRVSLSQSALVTLEEKVLPAGHSIRRGATRGRRTGYVLENGSELVLGGLDNSDRVMSSEYDMILACEATELTLSDWEKLLTRLRHGIMPYQQAIAECNPSHPGHWLNVRANTGLMRRLNSRHEDNPIFFDRQSGLYTAAGQTYRATLDRLSGVRRKRLLDGLWAAPEGLVYEAFADHVISGPGADCDEVTDAQPLAIFAGIDWGWRDPAAAVVGVLRPDRRLYVVEEFYARRVPLDELVEKIAALLKRWNVEYCFADGSRPDLIDQLCRHDVPCQKAPLASIAAGISVVESRLMADKLKIVSSCHNLIQEASEYQYAADESQKATATPQPGSDHAMDALRYMVTGMERMIQADGPGISEDGESQNAPEAIRDARGWTFTDIWGE
jgi:phage terminase large subunit